MWAPHGSGGFQYDNKSNKLAEHPEDPATMVLLETATSCVLLDRNGNPIAGTEKEDVKINTMFKFNEEGKVLMIKHGEDKEYLEVPFTLTLSAEQH